MRAMIFVWASLLVAVANQGLAQNYYYYGQPAPVYYPQPQPVIVFGQPAPPSRYATSVIYFGLSPMTNYTYPVAAAGGYGNAQVVGPYLAGYQPGIYGPRPIYYSAPPTPPGMLDAPLRRNPAGKQSTVRW